MAFMQLLQKLQRSTFLGTLKLTLDQAKDSQLLNTWSVNVTPTATTDKIKTASSLQ